MRYFNRARGRQGGFRGRQSRYEGVDARTIIRARARNRTRFGGEGSTSVAYRNADYLGRNVRMGRRFGARSSLNVSVRRNNDGGETSSGKKVLLKDGVLTVMAAPNKASNRMADDDSEEDEDALDQATRKKVKTTGEGIRVTARNVSAAWKRTMEPNMEDEEQADSDNVETLTLDDLPEVKKPDHRRDPTRSSGPARRPGNKFADPSRFQGRLDVVTERTPDASSMVLVTNLHDQVTEDDVAELFGNVGPIFGAQFVQPGVALITYLMAEDAKHACAVYNKRLLDGQPMHCAMFVQPPPHQSRPVVLSPLATPAIPSTSHYQTAWNQPLWPAYSTGDSPVKFTVCMP